MTNTGSQDLVIMKLEAKRMIFHWVCPGISWILRLAGIFGEGNEKGNTSKRVALSLPLPVPRTQVRNGLRGGKCVAFCEVFLRFLNAKTTLVLTGGLHVHCSVAPTIGLSLSPLTQARTIKGDPP